MVNTVERDKIFNEVMGIQEPAMTPEEIALMINKQIIAKGKLPNHFTVMDENSENPEVIIFDRKLKLYNRYKTEEFHKDNPDRKNRIESTVYSRYDKKELMGMIKNSEIFVMAIV